MHYTLDVYLFLFVRIAVVILRILLAGRLFLTVHDSLSFDRRFLSLQGIRDVCLQNREPEIEFEREIFRGVLHVSVRVSDRSHHI